MHWLHNLAVSAQCILVVLISSATGPAESELAPGTVAEVSLCMAVT